MLLKKIILENFRQYKDRNEISFATDSEKNITFVMGGNGFGKTTLCQSFLWCMYGESDFKKPDDILSQSHFETMREGSTKSTSVCLQMSHGGKDYEITRKKTFQKKGDKLKEFAIAFSVRYVENGEQKELSHKEKEMFVEEILPKELAKYFFLSGEKIEKMSEDIKNGRSRAFGDAVNTLLDLDYYKTTLSHLKAISKEYSSTSISNANDDLNRINNELRNNRLLLDREKKALITEEGNRDYHNEKIIDCKSKLKGIVSAESIVKKLDQQQNRLGVVNQNIGRELDAGIADFVKAAPFFFASKKMDAMLEVLQQAVDIESDDIPDKLHADLIDWIEARGQCVCGTCIKKDEEPYNLLEKWRHVVPPESIGTLINSVKRETVDKKRLGEDLLAGIESRKGRILDYQDTVDELKDEIEDLRNQLANSTDTSEIERELRVSLADYNRSLSNIAEHQKNIINLESSLERLDRDRHFWLQQDKEGRKVLAWKDAADTLIAKFQNELEKDESEKREFLINSVQDAFGKIYDASFTISIDDAYNITTTSSKELSTGQGLAVIFAFLSGLLDVIKNSKNNSTQLESYPLVLDAPFSVLDKGRIDALCDILPKVSEQVIIFIKDVDGDIAKQKMGSKIGKSYVLNPVDNTFQCTQIEEE